MKTTVKLILSLVAIGYPTMLVANFAGLPVPTFATLVESAVAIVAVSAVTLLMLKDYAKPRTSLALHSRPVRNGQTVVPFQPCDKVDCLAA